MREIEPVTERSPLLVMDPVSHPKAVDIERSEPETLTLEVNEPSYLAAGILCFLIGFSGLTFGWDVGTIAGIVNMPDFVRRFGEMRDGEYVLPESRMGLIVSITSVGAALGGLTLTRISDTSGRKTCLLLSMAVYFTGLVVQISASSNWVQYFLGRLITGFSFGCTVVVGPNFISEISPRAVRGFMVTIFQVMSTFGTFIGNCVVYACNHHYSNFLQWRVPVGICFGWCILTVVTIVCAPESPRFLVLKGRHEEAESALAKINDSPKSSPVVQGELQMILESAGTSSSSWSDLLTGQPKIFYRVFMVVMLQVLQQLSGINYFFYYATTVFRSVGLKDSYITSIILGTVNFLGTIVGLFLVDMFGRRKPLIIGGSIMALCLLLFATLGTKLLYPGGVFGVDSNTAVGNAMIVCSCIFIFVYAPTWGPIVYAIMAETYPVPLKAKASGVAMTGNWVFCFLIAFFTPSISAAIHFAFGYVFFGCTVFGVLFVVTCVPETKGLNLEDIDTLYSDFTPGLAFRAK